MKLIKLIVVFLQLYIPRALSKPTTNDQQPSIIVIGAGPAGIAATTRLLENKFNNVLLLEAENRIGGRVNSVKFGDAFIDLGAEWCHGVKDNVVYDLVKDLNVLKHTETPKTVYHSSKKHIDPNFGKDLVTMMETIYVPDGHRDEIEGKTVGHYCIDKYNTSIHEKYQKDAEKLEIAKSSIELFHHLVLSSEGAFSWFDPSAQSDYKDCEGDLNLNWNGYGYRMALDVLMKRYPDPSKQLPMDKVTLLNKEVDKIMWNETHHKAVIVRCSDNSSYEADHVIFTPSIGVLKAEHEKMFEPHLPVEKREAIRQVGFGAVMKIVMHFNKNWWGTGDNFTGFHFIWSDYDKHQALKEYPGARIKEDRTWLTELFSIIPVEHNPNVLIGWLTGDMIPDIEQLSNENLIHGVVFVMNKFLGHQYNISEPDKILRTSWFSNPHFRGTYSYQTIDARKNRDTAEVVLSQPLMKSDGVQPILQFAGEHTHPYYYSTVHGAIETGRREADRIINLYLNKK